MHDNSQLAKRDEDVGLRRPASSDATDITLDSMLAWSPLHQLMQEARCGAGLPADPSTPQIKPGETRTLFSTSLSAHVSSAVGAERRVCLVRQLLRGALPELGVF